METLLNEALNNGIWVGLAVFLIVYNIKANEKQACIQVAREEQYQRLLNDLIDKYAIIFQIKTDIAIIKDMLANQNSKIP